jgi:hypothetical protein
VCVNVIEAEVIWSYYKEIPGGFMYLSPSDDGLGGY